jgi:hypothetical protein
LGRLFPQLQPRDQSVERMASRIPFTIGVSR